mgnify:CR=1 FL=1
MHSGAAGAPASTGVDVSNVWNEFGRGYFAFYISGPWNIGEFKRRLPASEQGDWMTAPLPGPNGPGASIAGGSSLVVFRARAVEGCGVAVDRISLPGPTFSAGSTSLPAICRRDASAWRDAPLADDVYARAFRDQLERVKPAPKVAGVGAHRQPRCGWWPSARCHGQLSVDQAAKELDARADEILEKRRWMLARGERALRFDRAAWWFVAPALLVIARVLLPAGRCRAC